MTAPHPRSWRIWLWALPVVMGLIFWQGRDTSAVVVTEVAAVSDVTRLLAVNGKIAPLRSVQIRSAVSGSVVAVNAVDGDNVVAGAVLARLDDAAQMAAVVQAQTALTQARARSDEAAAQHGRDITLRGNITVTALETGRLGMVSAAQDVIRQEATLAQANLLLAHYKVTAPFAGKIMSSAVDLGQLVDPAAPLFSLADTRDLVVEAVVDETYASQLVPGQIAQLQVIGARAVLSGRLIFVAPRIDAASGGIAIKIAFDQPPKAVVGQTVTANLVIDTTRALTVPRGALRGEAVFVVIAGQARMTPVTTVDWPAERLIVTDGLKAGDLVILTALGLVDGADVRVK